MFNSLGNDKEQIKENMNESEDKKDYLRDPSEYTKRYLKSLKRLT